MALAVLAVQVSVPATLAVAEGVPEQGAEAPASAKEQGEPKSEEEAPVSAKEQGEPKSEEEAPV
ncbi:MAG: hypothetical protein KBA28_06115, partial [Syntrophaceae bacterium]|nr:hypothetical protein [Syntrophaceae bacterium]